MSTDKHGAGKGHKEGKLGLFHPNPAGFMDSETLRKMLYRKGKASKN